MNKTIVGPMLTALYASVNCLNSCLTVLNTHTNIAFKCEIGKLHSGPVCTVCVYVNASLKLIQAWSPTCVQCMELSPL